VLSLTTTGFAIGGLSVKGLLLVKTVATLRRAASVAVIIAFYRYFVKARSLPGTISIGALAQVWYNRAANEPRCKPR